MALRVSEFSCRWPSTRGNTSTFSGLRKQPHFLRSNPIQCNMVLAGNKFASGHLKLQNLKPRTCLRSWKPCRVKSDDNPQTTDIESVSLDENTLKQELEMAIQEENYAKAAKLRDTLKTLQEDSKASVLSVNARFYESFRNGDLATMQSLWVKSGNACCVHPGAKGIMGYDYVMESWEVVWMNYDFPLDIELKEVQVHVWGDVGYITCMEFVKTKGSNSWGAQFVTNMFERIDGKWFICVHHASPVDI
ncbi:PREDICTED: uncharacterized protein LOC104823270 [Tarenaya hassleriana]|uniref:uncharacterized protein LOC104823270 n=1 Tax=Tarenaya hassleriana TaxID=28532 RepID=UPI00053C94B4|nr:PREDICTED: uncharacterized protein LOC104823270 [Tarenaya hassleriana]